MRSSKKISEPEAFASALHTALKAIRLGDKSEAEIREKLNLFSQEICDEVVAKLKMDRLVDDQRLVENAILNWMSMPIAKKIAPPRLREKLSARGIANADLAPLDSLPMPPLTAMLQDRFDATRASDIARAARWLAGKGYEEEEVRTAIEEFFSM